ncbi:hypothetical protein MLD38_034879 [Melastoma candidum]|uniref:Uncharacterized protein n=1 Tax=Melastoma candidum TaxID=119954 RepID=A0ACB9MAZ1_9MYRT|nr:hypothetical protein MLD38_034879 [Melastoma candidum]
MSSKEEERVSPRRPYHCPLVLLLLLETLLKASAAAAGTTTDAAYILLFKSKADPHNHLPFPANASARFCRWPGVQCVGFRVTRLVIRDFPLSGTFPAGTLAHLDQLRVLSLQNDSLSGSIPDLSALVNLRSLFLDHNSFSGNFPSSVLSLHRIRTLDLSSNNLTGPLPPRLSDLDRIYYLRLDSNGFGGTLPSLNQSSLQTFNVSRNNLTGPVPVTDVLSRFGLSSYSGNPGLCGMIINKACGSVPPFFGLSSASGAPELLPSPPSAPLGQSAEVHGGLSITHADPRPTHKRHKRMAVIAAFSAGVFVLASSLLCLALALRKRGSSYNKAPEQAEDGEEMAEAATALRAEQENELEVKVKRAQLGKSGSLAFCAGEAPVYTMEQLMRASAELLGRGTAGTTYKAVLDSGLIVGVKRLDAGMFRPTADFEPQMEAIGGLRHPNLVPLRSYLQAKDERLLVYDYQPNGSLYSLIHGSKSARARPLHWTSCLKIAEDVAQGLSYIHQAWRLVHGNLKSSNVLLGPDFEACVSDYCLSILVEPSPDDDPDLAAYKAPELLNGSAGQHATCKSDVYAYGVLLLEVLASRQPSQQPDLAPGGMMSWVISTREDNCGGDDRLGMMLEVALLCRKKAPEQRPTMWQVLKMLQEIKEATGEEDNEAVLPSELS